MKLTSYCNRIIAFSFYSLFLLVPLVFSGKTSELFEFNKMWLTFGITIIITATWICKMITEKKFAIKRTPLDIPILLFLLSQIISTVISLDTHVSIWGYYSRFNGGLLSTITYIMLYYALVTNLSPSQILRSLSVALTSGLIVALWGFPAHFGYDPTCLIFTGKFDTSCWTEAFHPTVRTFSTLGQPAWLAAYLAILLPLSMAFFLNVHKKINIINKTNKKTFIPYALYFILSPLFYVSLIFANTRAGLVAFWTSNIIFWTILLLSPAIKTTPGGHKTILKQFVMLNSCFLILTFIFGGPIGPLEKFTLPKLTQHAITQAHAQTNEIPTPPATTNITDSGKIRLHVWKGAIEAWKNNPLIGTGVETFAYAYYQHRPIEHNLTSEWDYLYNKAHNEYLNYLTTTGAIGLGTYLLIVILFLYQSSKYIINSKSQLPNPKQIQISDFDIRILTIALLSSYLSILITNFFGFSVVITNIYLFLIPAMIFILNSQLNHKSLTFPATSRLDQKPTPVNSYQWISITAIAIISCYLLLSLFKYWYADTVYAYGSNLNKINEYQQAYTHLSEAVNIKPSEPVYKDELAINLAILSTALMSQKESSAAAQFAQNAVALNNEITTNHPNNVIFWKNRVRVLYSLSQADPDNEQKYLLEALKAIQKANQLAPTDAKISYNLGVLYGQTGNTPKGIETLQNTIKLKSDYRDAYYALALFHRESGSNDQATKTLQYILDHFAPNDKQTKDTLKTWNEN